MKKGLVELVFILDRSGSMSGLEKDTIGGFNSLLERQKKQDGEATVTTVLFDDKYELLHDRINLAGIAPITDRDYYVRGSTALLDAIGRTIDKISNAQKHTAEDARAETVMVVITTDGQENASREYSHDKIKAMIERQKEKYGWEFLFIGANIDAVGTAAKMGIAADRAANYKADAQGTAMVFGTASAAVASKRAAPAAALSPQWSRAIDEDYKSRT